MSTWMWDLLGALLALFIVVVTVVDLLVAAAIIHFLRNTRRERAHGVPDWHESSRVAERPVDAAAVGAATGHRPRVRV